MRLWSLMKMKMMMMMKRKIMKMMKHGSSDRRWDDGGDEG